MKDKILSYLLQKKSPASSKEIVEAVFKMKNVVPGVADRLVVSVVKDERFVYQTNDGMWAVNEEEPATKNDDGRFALCAILPQRVNHWHDWQSIGLACVSLDRVLEKKVLLNRSQHDILDEKFALDILHTVNRYGANNPVIFSGFGNQISQLRLATLYHLGLDPEFELWSIKQWVRQLFPEQKINDEKSLSAVLKTDCLETNDISIRLGLLIDQFFTVVGLMHDRGIFSVQDIRKFLQTGVDEFDFSPFGFDRSFVEQLPESPGVYIMKDRQNSIIYVGKAKNIHNRVSGYFRNQQPEKKLETIHKNLDRIEIITTGSELEALLLEDRLIQEYQPPINTQTEIHSRYKNRNRFPQILILPAAEVDKAVLVLVHPENGIDQMIVEREAEQLTEVKEKIQKIFFTKTIQDRRQLEIVLSWLSLNDESVQNIDMRSISTVGEAVKILQYHLHDISARKTIYYITQEGHS
ncbi:nucleotide excision repair endonuclease [candidate division KSB1 bacterium]|nr:nucleotide excision repair endonuclease [candidate division KSB1 bacterium]